MPGTQDQNKIGVLFLAEALHPGGAERQLELLMDNLDTSRFTPHLLTWIDAGQPYQNDSKRYEWIQVLRNHKFDFSPLWHAKRMIDKGQIQIVHGMLDTGNLYGGILKILKKKKIVFVASERCSERKLGFFQAIHKPRVHRIADVTVGNSKKGLEFISSMGIPESRLCLISNGLNTDVFTPADEGTKKRLKNKLFGHLDAQKVLLFVGTLYPAKNQLGLIRALADVNWQSTHLILVGKHNHDYVAEIQNAIKEYNLESKIEIYGPQSDIENWYRAADGLILNSIHEGTPNVVLEAMACGLPVIATSVGDIPRYLNDEIGWLVTSGDQSQLTSVLKQFDQFPSSELAAKGALASAHIEALGLTKSNLVERHQELYLSLLGDAH